MQNQSISSVCSTSIAVSDNPVAPLKALLESLSPTNIFFISDYNTNCFAQSLHEEIKHIFSSHLISIPPGDANKNLDTLSAVWMELSDNNATRHSVIINVGGGMVTDLGGFAAATFKRGVKYINIPTSLLAAVDASTGGKTAINFNGLKNEIGAFALPVASIISPQYFSSLSETEFLSGYAEMLKTALLFDKDLSLKMLDVETFRANTEGFSDALERCIAHKAYVTGADPLENGLRKTLNLGHTAGHAIESLCLDKNTPVPHGIAVAHGILAEMILSHFSLKFPSDILHLYASMLKEYYPRLPYTCPDIDSLIEIMKHDKKNRSQSQPNFSLLEDIAKPIYDCVPTDTEIRQALETARDMLP